MPHKEPTPGELLEQIERLQPEMLERSGFDAEKVRRIRALLKQGRLNSDPGTIADALLRDARELLKKSGQ